MEIYTLGNRGGKTMRVRLSGHSQNIWHTSIIYVSRKVADRIESALGPGPYTNPEGDFSQAQKVIVHVKEDPRDVEVKHSCGHTQTHRVSGNTMSAINLQIEESQYSKCDACLGE